MKVLHIIATPRGERSRTLEVSEAFFKSFKKQHPESIIDELNLFREEIPPLTIKTIDGKYALLTEKELSAELKQAWLPIKHQIERFLAAELYVISTPMWNFTIPYVLKHYIDVIVQPKYLFQYKSSGGVEGLVKNKKMVVIASRGGAYNSVKSLPYDFQEPYLRTIFGFVGIHDITFIKAESMDSQKELQAENLQEAIVAARKLGKELY